VEGLPAKTFELQVPIQSYFLILFFVPVSTFLAFSPLSSSLFLSQQWFGVVCGDKSKGGRKKPGIS
jgi:hypothetical protein